MRWVVVDANTIVQGAWRLDSAAWKVLLYMASHGRIDLVVPEVVIREVLGRYRDAVEDGVRAHDKATRTLERLGCPTSGDPPLEVDTVVEQYAHYLRSTISTASAATPKPAEDLDVLELAHRAIERRAPFNKQGNGFRDALLWSHVLDLTKRPLFGYRGMITLISNDHTAFGDGEGLAPELVAELKEEGFEEGTVQLVETVGDFINRSGVADPALTSEIAELVEAEQAQLGEDIRRLLTGDDVETGSNQVRAFVTEVHEPVRLYLAAVASDPQDELIYVGLEVEVSVDIDVEEWKVDGISTWSATHTLVFDAEATYEPESKTLDNLSAALHIEAGVFTDWG